MKYAILSDIHGNSDALEAVLNEVKSLKITHIFNLGDLVGYYYNTKKCIELLELFVYQSIQGNHERMLYDSRKNQIQRSNYLKKYGSSFEIALKLLTYEQLEKYTNLPSSLSIKFNEDVALLCHGSPWGQDEYIYQNSSSEIFEKLFSMPQRYTFIGHNHYQFKITQNEKILISVGSVGQNRKVGGIANWATFDETTNQIDLKSTQYSTQPLKNMVASTDPNLAYLTEILSRH